MRQIPAAVAVIGLTALALVGCAPSGPADSGCERVTAPASSLDRVRVKYVEVGRPAPTKVDLLRRAMEDGLVAEDSGGA